MSDETPKTEPTAPTLLDLFAMAALSGLLANSMLGGEIDGYCKDAYKYAAAMLKARPQ